MSQPGDRRRFCFYAERRGVHFELADPSRDYDLVVLSTNADIGVWRHYPHGRGKVVYELIDSYLAVSRFQPKSLLRGVAKYATRNTRSLVLDYRSATEDMCRRADAVVCSTEEQKVTYRALCANVHVILDSHSELRGRPKTDFSIGDTVNLVWEGLGYTVQTLKGVAPVLRELAAERSLALHIISDLRIPRLAGRFGMHTDAVIRRIMPGTYLYQWNVHMLPELVTACDVALIPLDLTDPFARGKPENKLLLMWRLGMPVITSATPAYHRAMVGAGLDLSCATTADWAANLRRILSDEGLRRTASRRGLEFAASNHSDEQLLTRWDRLFESVLA